MFFRLFPTQMKGFFQVFLGPFIFIEFFFVKQQHFRVQVDPRSKHSLHLLNDTSIVNFFVRNPVTVAR